MAQQYIAHMLWVGAGGFLGSVTRFAVGELANRLFPLTAFPYGTLTVNVMGCFLMGLLTGLADTHQLMGPNLRLFLTIGFLGGFTTFSAFGYETILLANNTQTFKAIINVGLHLFLGLAAVWSGQNLARLLLGFMASDGHSEF